MEGILDPIRVISPNEKNTRVKGKLTIFNLLVKPRFFFMFSGKKYNFMHLCLSKCIKLYNSQKRKIYVPTLPNVFRPVTQHTFFFFLIFSCFMELDSIRVIRPTVTPVLRVN